MNLSNITSIKKKKSSKQDMGGQRGIFSLTIFEKILDNLLLNDFYEDVNIGMTSSKIGRRKKRHAKDHLFILYNVIDSINKGNNKDKSVDILVYNVETAFDKLFWMIV